MPTDSRPRIVGLTGAKRSGKGTVASIIQTAAYNRQWTVERFAFARRLKEAACWVRPDLAARIRNDIKDAEVRDFLQRFGTEVGREIDRDLWIKGLLWDLSQSSADVILVDDMRFPNEWEVLRQRGAVTVRVTCDDAVRRQRERDATGRWPSTTEEAHASETALEKYWMQFTVDSTNAETVQRDLPAVLTAVLGDSAHRLRAV